MDINAPLNEIDWSVLTVFRLSIVLSVFLFVLQMGLMLSHYWWRIIPLRRELRRTEAKTRLLAPPVGWTFSYHLLVAVILAMIGVGAAQSAYQGSPGTALSYLGPPLIFALTVVVNRFDRYYSRDLNEVYRDHVRDRLRR